MYKFNAMYIKIAMAFSRETEKSNPKFIYSHKRPCIAKVVLRNKAGGIAVLQTILQILIFKTLWHWHKDRHIDKWNRINSPDITPHICVQCIFL